jgi:hypothetical protein
MNKFTSKKTVYNDNEITYIETMEDFIYCFKGYESIRYKTSTGKLFMYAVSNLDTTNISKFYVNDYVKLRGFTTIKEGLKQVKQDLLSLARIDGVTRASKKNFFYANIIISVKLENKYVYVEFNNEFVEFIKQMYFWIPTAVFKTKDKYAPYSWAIGYELFKYIKSNKHARQQKSFKRNVASLIKYSNLQTLIDTDRQKQLLYTPFVKSLKHLNEIQDVIEIEIPKYTSDFTKNQIEIKIIDDTLLDCYKYTINQNIEFNKSKKQVNIKKARELKKRGYTIDQISDELKVSNRTVSYYLK